MVFLDTNIAIYYVEQPVVWGQKAAARIQSLLAANEVLASGDIVRMECLVVPFKKNDAKLINDWNQFFQALTIFPVTAQVCEPAARIRADYGFKPLDSLNVATAVEHGCSMFLTNDIRLNRFSGISVEVTK